jgi:hypothetical protein
LFLKALFPLCSIALLLEEKKKKKNFEFSNNKKNMADSGEQGRPHAHGQEAREQGAFLDYDGRANDVDKLSSVLKNKEPTRLHPSLRASEAVSAVANRGGTRRSSSRSGAARSRADGVEVVEKRRERKRGRASELFFRRRFFSSRRFFSFV